MLIEIGKKEKIIQIYAPTAAHEEAEMDQLYDDSTTAVKDKTNNYYGNFQQKKIGRYAK